MKAVAPDTTAAVPAREVPPLGCNGVAGARNVTCISFGRDLYDPWGSRLVPHERGMHSIHPAEVALWICIEDPQAVANLAPPVWNTMRSRCYKVFRGFPGLSRSTSWKRFPKSSRCMPLSAGLRHTIEEINDTSLQRILRPYDEECISLDQLFEDF
jgi:hypothetical protein